MELHSSACKRVQIVSLTYKVCILSQQGIYRTLARCTEMGSVGRDEMLLCEIWQIELNFGPSGFHTPQIPECSCLIKHNFFANITQILRHAYECSRV